MKYIDFDQSSSIRNYLYLEVPGLKDCVQKQKPDKLRTAFLVQGWIGELATYPQRDLLLLPPYDNLAKMLISLQAFECGVWCGGCAMLYAEALNACYVPAIIYSYGEGELSHETTLIGIKHAAKFKYYLIDSYLGYYFEDTEGNPLEFIKMLRYVARGKYDQIVRVDKKLYRHLLCKEDRPASFYSWLFDDGNPPAVGAKVGRNVVYPGASHNVSKLLASGGFADLANAARGEKPMGEFMFDLMLVNPSFSRIRPSCAECYLDWDLHEKVIQCLL